MQQAARLQEQALAVGKAVVVPELVEQPRGELGNLTAVRQVESKAVTDRFGARENLLFEILRSKTAARLAQIQQHAGPQ